MSKTQWAWKTSEDKGKKVQFVEINGQRFDLVPGKQSEVEEFAARVEDAKSIVVTLMRAQVAFESGQADYANACERLEALRFERTKAEVKMAEVGADLGAFFTPPGIVEKFGFDSVGFTKFYKEALKHLEAPPKK